MLMIETRILIVISVLIESYLHSSIIPTFGQQSSECKIINILYTNF